MATVAARSQAGASKPGVEKFYAITIPAIALLAIMLVWLGTLLFSRDPLPAASVQLLSTSPAQNNGAVIPQALPSEAVIAAPDPNSLQKTVRWAHKVLTQPRSAQEKAVAPFGIHGQGLAVRWTLPAKLAQATDTITVQTAFESVLLLRAPPLLVADESSVDWLSLTAVSRRTHSYQNWKMRSSLQLERPPTPRVSGLQLDGLVDRIEINDRLVVITMFANSELHDLLLDNP